MIKVQCEDEIEILKLCDRYLDAEIPEFFFNRFSVFRHDEQYLLICLFRSWKGFNDILDVYRSGLF